MFTFSLLTSYNNFYFKKKDGGGYSLVGLLNHVAKFSSPFELKNSSYISLLSNIFSTSVNNFIFYKAGFNFLRSSISIKIIKFLFYEKIKKLSEIIFNKFL